MADASSLLTSFRTIAGSIGSAVFVGTMTAVSAGSGAAYGDGALMHGMNRSFLWMTVGALVLLAISLFAVKTDSRRRGLRVRRQAAGAEISALRRFFKISETIRKHFLNKAAVSSPQKTAKAAINSGGNES